MWKASREGVFSLNNQQHANSTDTISRNWEQLHKVINQSPAIICIIDEKGRLVQVSASIRDLLGYRPEELLFKHSFRFIHPDDVAFTMENQAKVRSGTYVQGFENRCVHKDGTSVYMKWSARWNCEDNLMYCVGVDVSDLKKSLEEKEVLLSEVHHRVKNNLAVVSGMLQLEAFDEQDEQVKAKLMEFVSRIHSIANVHEHLYKSNSFSQLNFSKSLKALVEKAIDSYQSTTVVPEFKLDPVQLNINQAMPVSMIVNEVITAILKHSRSGLKARPVKAELLENGENINLNITDSGLELSEVMESSDGKSLGLQLIDQLSKQLEGRYCYDSCEQGSRFSLKFQKADPKGVGNSYL